MMKIETRLRVKKAPNGRQWHIYAVPRGWGALVPSMCVAKVYPLSSYSEWEQVRLAVWNLLALRDARSRRDASDAR